MTTSAVLLWAQRVVARKHEPAHVLLELPADATPVQAQIAFHKIARMAHPDLHRQAMTPDELELLTSAYATVASAYQTIRSQVKQVVRTRPKSVDLAKGSSPPVGPLPKPGDLAAPQKPEHGAPHKLRASTEPGAATPRAGSTTGQQMNAKAVVYFRKAEQALRRGDLKAAVLQLKLACAADPSSSFLRSALAEVEAEVRKG